MKRLALACSLLASAAAFADPSGHKWFITGTQAVPYKVFSHTTINGMPANSFGTTILPRVQEAFLNWTATRVACTSWRSTYAGAFTTPADHNAQNGNDNENRVIWLGGAEWRYNNSTLGLTTTLYFPGTGQIVDADMEMNNNTVWSNTGNFNAYDFESVVLHEAGHFLGLDHTQNVGTAVMFPTVSNGDRKVQLTTTDVNDVCGVYPGSGTATQGNPCTADSQCTAAGLVCRNASGSTGGKICTVNCTGGQACPTPLTCQAANTGMACLSPPGPADYCKFCVDGTDCSTGQCLTDGAGHNWCTNACSQTSPCPSGSTCLDVNTGGGCAGGSCICAPSTSGGIKCPGQCTGATCPTPGYACVSGTCEASGNEGDRCEVSGICKPCKLCIGTASAANCRGCCGGPAAGGDCNGCAAFTCPAMQSCVGLQGAPTVQICYPQGGADLCQACSATVTCLNGNTCIGGKCHASCNPDSPGTCGACQPAGTSGVCACAGEERNEGDACGGAGVAACRTGLTCASGFCKRPCVIGNPNSCPSGSVCRNTSGTAVCEADTAGARCASCNGVNCGAGLTCHQGRCYTTCNVAVKPGPCDSSCVDVGSNVNVCACDDQIRGSGEPCGASPIGACGSGLLCIAGTCVGECNPNLTTTCPLLTECKLLAGTQFTFVCQPIDMNPGGGAGGGGGATDCTSSSVTCPNGTVCKPNGDGTATCRSSATCDPNAAVSQCPADKLCRADSNGTFGCLSPTLDNGPGCGCSSVDGAFVLALAGLFASRRRRK